MTRPREELRTRLAERIESLGWPAVEVVVERPARPEHGDWASPVALALARPLGRGPREIARELAGVAVDPGTFEEITVAGPGFLNARLSPAYLREGVRRVLEAGSAYGSSQRLAGWRPNVEFVSSNPTGPLHVGHARNAVLGDAIAAFLESQGAQVTREYYFNDAGRQMDILGASVYARYRQLWDPDFPFPEEGYAGGYIEDLAAGLRDEVGERYRDTEPGEWLPEVRRFAGERIAAGIREDLARFRVEFDVWFNESSLYRDGRLEETIEALRAKDAVYDKDGAVWLRATVWGDEEDRVLVKSSGDPTYLLPDIAYHLDKRTRRFDAAIDVWGADHHSYAVRMQAALQALGFPPGWLRTVIYQQVSLIEDGQEVRLSTRRNRMVTLRELLDDIGVDVARYFLLMRKGDTHMTFDLDLARRQSDENPVYYVQYAHARIAGVFGRLEEHAWDPRESGVPETLDRLTADTELDVLRALDDFPDVVSDAADALEPHRVTDYLESLARRFHLWYHAERFLVGDRDLAQARLALARAVQTVLANGLGLLGVSAPETM
ncbi:MAG TPA: arginine--tRNA ligase [Gemmatimonadota bacterium]|nr:arginine--tRNA ligase [Gemmatimonadota bacterium]